MASLTFSRGVHFRSVRVACFGRPAGWLASFAATLLALTSLPLCQAEDGLLTALRAASASAPVIEPFELGDPKFQVFRMNSTVISRQGERYSVVKVRIPAGEPQPMVWMFSDIGTIQEYE